jgi:hypothetical protein
MLGESYVQAPQPVSSSGKLAFPKQALLFPEGKYIIPIKSRPVTLLKTTTWHACMHD